MKSGSIIRAALIWTVFAGCQKSIPPTEELNWAIGTWHGKRQAAEDGKNVPMTVRVEQVPGGQVERLQVDLTPRPYIGFTLRSRDPASGRWTMIYANSTRQTIGRLDGKLEAKRSTWESVGPDGSHASRFVSEQLDANHWRRTQFVSEDAGKTWKTLFRDELERDTVTAL
jgi:hypothetical protein